MVSLNSGFPLQKDERLIVEVESKLYMTSPYFLLRFIWGMIRPTLQILGIRKSGYLIVTDKRLIEYYVHTFFWFIKFRRYAESVSLKDVKMNVHYVKKGTFLFFCRAFQICYDRNSYICGFPLVRVYFILKGKEEEEANKIVSLIGDAVAAVKT